MNEQELLERLEATKRSLTTHSRVLALMAEQLTDQTTAVEAAISHIEALLTPEPATEIIRQKTTIRPRDGDVIDLAGKEFQGLWDTPYSTFPRGPWPTHSFLEAQGKPDSDQRFPLVVEGSAKGVTVRGGKAHHLMHHLAPWHVWKLGADSDGIRFEAGGDITIEGMWVDNVTDVFNPRGNATFHLKGCMATRVHDDVVENDEVLSGTIEDCYFAGHTFYSARGASNPGAVVTIDRCVIELLLQPFQGGSDADDMNHAAGYPFADGLGCGCLFKMEWDGDKQTDTHPQSGHVVVKDTVFLVPRHSSSSMKAMRWARGVYSNVTLVWLGEGDYPHMPPVGVTITRDRSVFDAAKADWLQRHPEVAARLQP